MKTLMAAFEKHLSGFIGERDFNKRDYNVANMTDAVSKGKQMMAEISLALNK